MPADFWANCFYGSPRQAFGEINTALFSGGLSELQALLAEKLAAADVDECCSAQAGAKRLSLLTFPAIGDARFGILFTAQGGARPQITAIYPVLAGIANELSVLNYHAWDNEALGMIACRTGDGGSIGFFDPFYFRDAGGLERGVRQRFSLAAVAYSVAIASNDEVEIGEGPLYEANLAEFLASHPDRRREEFPRLVVLLGSVHMLFPTASTGDYHYRGMILARERLNLAGSQLWRYQICFNPDDETRTPELWLYAADHVIQGREPNVCDYIEGYCAVSGYPLSRP